MFHHYINSWIAPVVMSASLTFAALGTACAAEPPQAPKIKASQVMEAPSVVDLDKKDEDDGEPRPYDETRDAKADVNATLMKAQAEGKKAIIVMGANWCHDSRDLAAHFMTPRFEKLLSEHYEYVYVDMGIRNRNLDIAAQFGVKKVEGTPTVIITDSNGKVLNGSTAKTWRDAASRSDDEIYEEFEDYALDAVTP